MKLMREAGSESIHDQALLTVVLLDRVQDTGRYPTRERLLKHFYFIGHSYDLGWSASFLRQVAGPLAGDAPLLGHERHAVEQRWLRQEKNLLLAGEAIAEGQLQAAAFAQPLLPQLVCLMELFRRFDREGLVRWAVVHHVVEALNAADVPVDVEAVKQRIAADAEPAWQALLEERTFSDAHLQRTLRGLVEQQLVVVKQWQRNEPPASTTEQDNTASGLWE
ncbi:hypothetical protein ACERK3_07925 [Phycisphaerales bacterium AB-hyl4]|uniref:Uncharacterized protein n=1 Tax=Natronomicrosphaera hydrolytica TaxID=3242702 RepID=A0ABV4U4G9_9BACT